MAFYYTIIRTLSKIIRRDEENFTTPSEENFTENNTLINNTKE